MAVYTSSEPNDHETKLSVRLHSQQDFAELYRQYWQPLYNFAYVKTHDGDVAEEIVQDLFVTLWEKRETLLIHSIQHYLFTAVRNRVIDYYKQMIFEDIDFIADPLTPDYPSFLDDLDMAIHEGITQLPNKTREIFLLNRFDGKSARQIAQQLHLPERTVEYHITQALRTLKRLLKDFLIVVLVFF